MADFKAMMAAKNKKRSPLDEIISVEENRDTIEKVEKIRDTTSISTPETLKNSTDALADTSNESSAKVENQRVSLITETKEVDKIREEKDSKKSNITTSSGKTKKSTTTKSKKVDKNRVEESLSDDASLNLSTFKETTSNQQAKQPEQPEKANQAEQDPIKKTNMSLSKTSVNYVRMNSKRQKISQMEYFKNIVLELKEKEETTKTLNYDNFELRKRHIIDSTPLNIILPESLLDWLRDEAAYNCISVSQFIDEFIQEKIHKELNVDK